MTIIRFAGPFVCLAACTYPALPELADATSEPPPFVNPHCTASPKTCGATGDGDCCASPFVHGGAFFRSYDLADDQKFYLKAYPATVSDFRLDKYEVTVGRFRQFLMAGYGTQFKPPAAGSGERANLPGSGWDSAWNTQLAADNPTLVAALKCDPMAQTWTDAPGANEQLPITCITWFEAMAFCVWDGGYLPTEAEWNYAAAGGDQQRAFPWSPAETPGLTTIDCSFANYSPNPNANDHCVGTPNKVGSESPKGDGRWGHADLSGNAVEWILDWYSQSYLPGTCNDCANLMPGMFRTLRGGGFYADAYAMRAGAHAGMDTQPSLRGPGVRCARP